MPYSALKELRSRWAEALLFDERKKDAIKKSPFRRTHPLVDAMGRALSTAERMPPKVPLERVLPFAEMCQYAILTQDRNLALRLRPLCSFPTLWTSERRFDAKEIEASIALLLGKEVPLFSDPYFLALGKRETFWGEEEMSSHEAARLIAGEGWEMALALQGEGIPLGAIRSGSIFIPAFGIEGEDSATFGVERAVLGGEWFSASASSESWFSVDAHLKSMTLRSVGVKIDSPLYFSFYIQADCARVEQEVYLPGQLKRYGGGGDKAIFERGGDRLQISHEAKTKMELIPLAGSDCFWGAHFLLRFAITPFETQDFYWFEK